MQTDPQIRFQLSRIHFLRQAAHWGKRWAEENAFTNGRWPMSDKDWRQTGHGAPWDTNVEMAMFHRSFASTIMNDGIPGL